MKLHPHRGNPPQRARVALLLAGLLLAGCASSGAGAAESDALLVTLHDYRANRHFELASESHTNRVEYYSTPRHDASRKIQSDEVMAALLDELERQGLEKHEAAGPAPSAGGGVIEYGLEIERGGASAHWLVGQGSNPGEAVRFHECAKTFFDLYNVTLSFQALENPEGRDLFERSRQDAASRAPR